MSTAEKILLTSSIPLAYAAPEKSISSHIKHLYSKLKDTEIDETSTPKHSNRKFTVQIGPLGEVYVVFPNTVYIYDWIPLSGEFNPYNLYLQCSIHCKDASKVLPLSYDRKNENTIALSTFLDSPNIDVYNHLNIMRFSLTRNKDYILNTRVVDSSYHVICNESTNNVHIYNGLKNLFSISTTIFDIKGDLLIYKTTNKATTTKLSISSNKNLANKLLNAMVDIVKDLRDGTNDYKEIIVEAYNTITKQTEYAECVDLVSLKTLFRIGLPQGISKLALSSSNLEFVSVSSRGDEILKWDFSQLKSTKRVILTDRHSRGQTATTISSLQLTNDHVLCVNSNSGSVHYLGSNGWKLPKLGAKYAQTVKTYFIKDFIVILDANDDILVANTEGKLLAFIDMNQIGDPKHEDVINSTQTTQTQIKSQTGYNSQSGYANTGYSSRNLNTGFNELTSTQKTSQQPVSASTPLVWNYQHMEIDVDTCGPYPFAFRNNHFTFTKLPDDESITPALFSSL
ncbi:hypothetical protein CANINC_000427 [Pichia inconspicua]|uniref:Uncharacterized protein n=1 Tax=Pichia inconspicua TaxID=52247 RepID=A0A4T0X667_9ASCO|nr:hypothetical protein CANINC_000427 [[Candida] inconspicua]